MVQSLALLWTVHAHQHCALGNIEVDDADGGLQGALGEPIYRGESLKENTSDSTIIASGNIIPLEDYHTWALSLAQRGPVDTTAWHLSLARLAPLIPPNSSAPLSVAVLAPPRFRVFDPRPQIQSITNHGNYSQSDKDFFSELDWPFAGQGPNPVPVPCVEFDYFSSIYVSSNGYRFTPPHIFLKPVLLDADKTKIAFFNLIVTRFKVAPASPKLFTIDVDIIDQIIGDMGKHFRLAKQG